MMPGRRALIYGQSTVLEEDKRFTRRVFSRLVDTLLSIGLGESLLRTGTTVLSILLLAGVIWLLRLFYTQSITDNGVANAAGAVPTLAVSEIGDVVPVSQETFAGIPRLAQEHTIIPSRPREDVIQYTVVDGDTVFGIAEKFGLQPETILWGNYYMLTGRSACLAAGQELNILPVDGTYHQWQEGEGLNGIAEYYGVKPEDILDYPGNHLDPDAIGDYTHPNIPPGTWLVVPGGRRQFISWSAPLGMTRENPASARVLGPGACDPVTGGAVGFGTFIWPANKHYLSGFDYTPNANHWGIDIAGNLGRSRVCHGCRCGGICGLE